MYILKITHFHVCVRCTIFFFFIDRKTLFQHCLTCEKGGDVRRPSFPLENFISSFFWVRPAAMLQRNYISFFFFWYLNVSVGPSENVERNVDAIYIKDIIIIYFEGWKLCWGCTKNIWIEIKQTQTYIYTQKIISSVFHFHFIALQLATPNSSRKPNQNNSNTKKGP